MWWCIEISITPSTRCAMNSFAHLFQQKNELWFDTINELQISKFWRKTSSVQIVDKLVLTHSLDPLGLRRDTWVFFRMFHVECSEKLFEIIPSFLFYVAPPNTGLFILFIWNHCVHPRCIFKDFFFSHTILIYGLAIHLTMLMDCNHTSSGRPYACLPRFN